MTESLPDRSATGRDAPASPVGTPPAAHSYVHDPAARADIVMLARKAHENSGALQRIHEHPFGFECNDGCGIVGLRAATSGDAGAHDATTEGSGKP